VRAHADGAGGALTPAGEWRSPARRKPFPALKALADSVLKRSAVATA